MWNHLYCYALHSRILSKLGARPQFPLDSKCGTESYSVIQHSYQTIYKFWTGGQPFLTQKLCQLIVHTALKTSNRKIDLPSETKTSWVEQFVRSQIIQHWEAKDDPEHLRTIRARLLFNEHRTGRLLGLYQRVLQIIPLNLPNFEFFIRQKTYFL
jgi:hypothetical protein